MKFRKLRAAPGDPAGTGLAGQQLVPPLVAVFAVASIRTPSVRTPSVRTLSARTLSICTPVSR